MRVEAEPVHPADIPRVLDFDAPVHDDSEAAVFCDPRPLFVDDPELAPEGMSVDGHGAPGDLGKGIWGPEDVNDVNRHGHIL